MLNKFVKIFGFSFCIILMNACFVVFASVNHIALIYPLNGATIRANSTFFVGNTNKNAKLKINGESVKVYPSGIFVRVFSLKKGDNTITLTSSLGNDIKTKVVKIHVPESTKVYRSTLPSFVPFEKTMAVAEDEAPLREKPYGNRLTPVKKGMIAECNGLYDKHCRVPYNGSYAYILKTFLKEINFVPVQGQQAEKIIFSDDKKYLYLNIPLEQPVLAGIETQKNIIKLRLEKTKFAFDNPEIKYSDIKSIKFDENYLWVELNSDKINGYDYFYNGNNFVLKIRKPFLKCIESKIVVIDPGHGGKEKGAIGPSAVPEKDINLQISKYLKDELLKAGARVYMTRENDAYVGLYDRIEYAQSKNADILVSIHNNSLPDGKNPYIIHGTETYYYHPQAEFLANSVQNELVKKTKFKDGGIKIKSLALARPMMPVSVLVEVGYMINPYEYEDLLLPENQKKYAVGIKNGIVDYFKH